MSDNRLTILHGAIALTALIGSIPCALNGTVIATDGDIPAVMDAGGTEANPAEYILGNTGKFDKDFNQAVTVGSTTTWNSLLIRNGSQFTVTDTHNSTIGFSDGSSGSVTVTGEGSTWTNSGDLTIGWDGSGEMLISNGGTVTSSSGRIGAFTGSSGSVTVTGTGSTWTNSGGLTIGEAGSGELLISEGGAVSSTNGFIGWSSATSASVIVTGAGSTWTHSGILFIGDSGLDEFGDPIPGRDGTRELVVSGNALVTIEDITIGSLDSFLRLDGGFFAWQGDNLTSLDDFLTDGEIQVWNMEAEAWENANGNPLFSFGYFATNAEALAFSGYEDLGGYTILTSTAIPEPRYYAILLSISGCMLFFARRRRMTKKHVA